MSPENTQAQSVEGSTRDQIRLRPQPFVKPSGHLLGRLVGEGDGTNPLGREIQLRDEVLDAAYQTERLSGPGSGQNQRGAQGRFDRVALSWKRLEVHALDVETSFRQTDF